MSSLRRSTLALLLAGLATACGGGGGGGDDAAPGALAAGPQDLHLVPVPGEALTVELRWSPAPATQLGGGGARYLVFQARFPVTAENLATVPSVLVDGTAAPITIERDDGLQHLRVSTADAEGRPLDLSPQLVVDTSERLVYRATDLTGADAMWSVRPDGTKRTRLSGTAGDIGGDHFVSPLGDRVAWREEDPSTGLQTVLVAPAGGDAAPLVLTAPGAELEHVRIDGFSPDGRLLAFQAAAEGTTDCGAYLARTDVPGSARPVTGTEDEVTNRTTFLPGGSELLVPARSLASGDSAFFAVPVAAGEGPVRRLTPATGPGSVVPGGTPYAVSPDGDRLAYVSLEETFDGMQSWLHVVPLSGGPPQRLDPQTLVFGGDLEPWGVDHFAWAPDGASVAYLFAHPDGTEEVRVAAADGSGSGHSVHPVTISGQRVGPPAFTPDARRLLFKQVLDGVSTLRTVSVEPGSPIETVSEAMQPEGDVTGHLLSPDGRTVIYTADAFEDGQTELLLVSLDRLGVATRLNAPLPLGADVRTPRFSPDGEQVVYAAGDAAFVVPADASQPARELVGAAVGQDLRRITWPGPAEQR